MAAEARRSIEGPDPHADTEGASESDDFLRAVAKAPHVAPPGDDRTRAGTTLGRFRITAKLGEGGMGVVYAARDLDLGREVALKVLPARALDDPERRERFLREARAAASVLHGNLAAVFAFGDDGGIGYIAMELAPGRPLRAVIQQANGPLPPGAAAYVAREIARGLAAAHQAGIVHRDIKPENVMIGPEGGVKILDFGLAKWVDGAPADHVGDSTAMATHEGRILGTPSYMSPEQACGKKEVDRRSDVFSVGVVLYEMITGARPFRGGTTVELLIAINRDPHAPARSLNPKVPPELERILDRALAKQPEARYADGGELAADLDRLLAATPESARIWKWAGGEPLDGDRPTDLGSSSRATTAVLAEGSGRRAACGPEVPNVDQDSAGVAPSARSAPRVDASAAPPAATTLAVLPFRNAGAADHDYLAEELTDDLIDELSMTRGLRVQSRGAIARFRGAEPDPREVGRALGVAVVVLGSVRKAGDAVRIAVRLVSAVDGFQLWARRIECPDREVLAINSEIARSVVEALTPGGGSARPPREAPADPAAIDLYIRARHEYRKFWPEHLARSIALFEQAAAIAPSDPTILAGMASALARRAFFAGAQEVERARDVAVRAVAAAPDHGEARLALGSVLFHMGDAEGAARELRAAVLRSPGHAEAHAALGRLLAEVGAFDEAIHRLEAALALDPDAPLARPELMRALALLGRWEACEATAAGLRDPEGAVGFWTLRARFALWRAEPAIAERHLRRIPEAQAAPGSVPALLLGIATRGRALEGSFDLDAISNLKDGGVRRRCFRFQIAAEAAAYLGDGRVALGALQRAAEGGLLDRAWLERCPLFDALRGDPLFARLHAEVARRADAVLEAYRAP